MTAATILLAGLASTLKVAEWGGEATRSIDERSEVTEAVDRMKKDLAHALYFTERTPHSLEFAMPGPAGDDIVVMRYHWSGVQGEPLTVSRNGSVESVIAADVRDFHVNFATRSVP